MFSIGLYRLWGTGLRTTLSIYKGEKCEVKEKKCYHEIVMVAPICEHVALGTRKSEKAKKSIVQMAQFT